MTKEFQHYTDKFDLTEPWVAKHKSMNSVDIQLKIKKSNKMNPCFQSGFIHTKLNGATKSMHLILFITFLPKIKGFRFSFLKKLKIGGTTKWRYNSIHYKLCTVLTSHMKNDMVYL